MDFETFTLVLLARRDDAPALDEQSADALQDAHMAHLAGLQAAGALLAAGPLHDERFRGLCIYRAAVGEARELAEADPAVRAGRFSVSAIPWSVPAGVLTFPGDVALPSSQGDLG